MSTTFYSALGVGPDADAETVRRAYRRRVKEVHPDVNDDPDADAQFRRLKTAKETLLDADERARYDRLGHASYVRHHVDCSAWTRADASESRTGTASPDDAETRAAGDTGTGTGDPGHDETDGVADDGGPDEPHGSPGTEPTSGAYRAGERDPDESADSGAGRGSNEGHTSAASTASAAAGTGGSTGRSGSGGSPGGRDRQRARGDAGDPTAASGGYASSSFWGVETEGVSTGSTRRPAWVRLVRGLREVGPWLFVHAAFLATALGTSLYVYVVLAGSNPSLPLLLALIGELVLAAFLSTIHVVTRLTR